MSLNESKGNMYEFITHTWNPIKGACLHDCAYCYMKRWGKQNPPRLVDAELKCKKGTGNFIFVGSSTDIFANDIPGDWILSVLESCRRDNDNKYLFQTKNPERFLSIVENTDLMPKNFVFCTTLESDVFYPEIMNKSPMPYCRAAFTEQISKYCKTFVTIEPILRFNLRPFVEMLKRCNAEQINIGADSCGHKMPEPSKDELLALIEQIKTFSTIEKKRNIERLLK